MPLEYVFPRIVSTIHRTIGNFPDLRELCTVGKTRILQWRDISSNHRRTFRLGIGVIGHCANWLCARRTSWFRAVIRPARVGVARAYMVKSCTFSSIKSGSESSRRVLQR
jgi:hypothetical protein